MNDAPNSPGLAHPRMTGTSGTLVFTHATVHVTPTRSVHGDVRIDGATITHAGAAGSPLPADARVVDVRGAAIVPIMVDNAVRARPTNDRNIHDLVPGNAATFAVIRGRVGESEIRGMLMVRPADLVAVVIAGRLMAWRGSPVPDASSERGAPTWVGTWRDNSHALEQHLLANGRYTETRSGHVDAYTGRYWTHRTHIAYLDDSGFWAFGEQYRGVLYHAGFVMIR